MGKSKKDLGVTNFYLGILASLGVVVDGHGEITAAEDIIGLVDAEKLWQTALATGCEMDCRVLVQCRPYRDQPSRYRKGRGQEP